MPGFGLKPENRSVIEAQRTLDKATADFKRLQELSELRTAAWQSSSQALATCEDYLRHGVPGNCKLEPVEVEPPSLLKGETVLDAISRLRRRGRELKADLARIAAAPFPSSYAKRKMREQIERLAQIGTPDVSMLLEQDRDVAFQTERVQSTVHNAQSGAIAFHEAPAVLPLLAFLAKETMIKALDALIDAEADPAAALSHSDRELRAAEVQADLLDIERQECAAIWLAQSQSLPVEFRADCSPLAILQLKLIAVPTYGSAAPTTIGHAFDFMGGR